MPETYLSPLAPHELERLEAPRSYGILDTEEEAAFDDVTHIAASLCQTPIALVSFVDGHRQWFESTLGVEETQTPIDCSICAFGILRPEMLVVPDTWRDSRFDNNPSVRTGPCLRFYAGAPLTNGEGYTLGMLCVLDIRPRLRNAGQLEALGALARQVMAQRELRRTVLRSRTAVELATAAMATLALGNI